MKEQQDQPLASADDEPLDVQPGYVMPRDHYERLAAEAAAEAAPAKK